MKEQRLHTPDGVRDIYNGECSKKLALQDKLHTCLKQYGYQDIETPSIEFFNIFAEEIGTTPSKDLYKFFDKEGNTLVLRPDFTPSIARCAAKYFSDTSLPVKLCYMGNTFVNASDYKLRLKESTQCGAELLGDASSSADAEMIAMVVDSLRASGLEDFQITVGHSAFLPALINASGMSDEQAELVTDYLSNKNTFGVDEVISELNLSQNLKDLFELLKIFDLSMDDLTKAKRISKDYPEIYKALDDLESLSAQLKIYDVQKYTSFELGIVSSIHYYTGIIFAAYTFGTGEAIVKGGRYDKLLSYFGKETPAIGFAIFVDQLMSALSRQKIEIPVAEEGILFVYTKENRTKAIQCAIELRKGGIPIELVRSNPQNDKDSYEAYAKNRHYTEVRYFTE